MVAILSTLGVLISTVIVGGLMWSVFRITHLHVALLPCLVFGALISPVDPIAVIDMLRALRAPKGLEALIAGESLFNGVGVVAFSALAALAGLTRSGIQAEVLSVSLFFVREVGGGAVLGLGAGYATYRAIKSVNDHSLELLLTLGLVMFTYSAALWLHVSGPIAVVVAGLVIGNPARRLAMTPRTKEHVDAFQVFILAPGRQAMAPSLIAIPVSLLARFVAVGLPVMGIHALRATTRGLIPILIWSGLRGGLSIAMVLSLPPFPQRDVFLACTYAVVLFSIVVQGLSVRRLLVHHGIGARSA